MGLICDFFNNCLIKKKKMEKRIYLFICVFVLLLSSCSKEVIEEVEPVAPPVVAEIPDEKFREYLVVNGLVEVSVIGGKPLATVTPKGQVVKRLRMKDAGVKSLAGIELFKELTYLRADGNEIAELDVSQNLKLDSLDISRNPFASLDLSKLTELRFLALEEVAVSSLDLSQQNKLEELSLINSKKLSSLKLNSPVLEEIDISGTKALTTLDLKAEIGLKKIRANYSSLTSLDVSNAPLLEVLALMGVEGIRSLNLLNNPKLKSARLDGMTQLAALNVTRNAQLLNLELDRTKIATIDLSANPLLESLRIPSSLTALDVTSNVVLHTFWCDGNDGSKLKALDLTRNTELRSLTFKWGARGLRLDLTKNTKLEIIDLANGGVIPIFGIYPNLRLYKGWINSPEGVLDFSRSTVLEHLDISGGGYTYTRLIVTSPKLKYLRISNSFNLNSLSLPQGGDFKLVIGKNYDLKEIDLTGNPNVKVSIETPGDGVPKIKR